MDRSYFLQPAEVKLVEAAYETLGGLHSKIVIAQWAVKNKVEGRYLKRLNATELNHCIQMGMHPRKLGYEVEIEL